MSTVRSFLSRLGPTWLAGAIAAGPATMASLLAAGAGFGYTLLWVVVLSAILGALAQYLATRLALGTEEGIVRTVERHLGEWWAWLLVVDVFLAAGLAQLVIMKTLADVSEALSGVDARLWGVAWAVVLAAGLAGGGYRVAELGAKIVVSLVVCAFVASLFVVPIDYSAAASGLVPSAFDGVGMALVAAGVLGGAVHVTIITMQTYTTRARGWTATDAGIARFDIATSMLVAFGLYSLAIFVVAASVLAGTGEVTAIGAAEALGPLVGPYAQALFFVGLLGAAVSTLGGNTVVPPYLLADKLGWDTDVSDSRYQALLAGVALASAAGAFIEGAFFPLLVLVLAFGLVGTPFAIALVLVLLNTRSVRVDAPGIVLNAGGVVLFVVASVTAGSFVAEEFEAVRQTGALAAGMSTVAVVFAAVLGTATLALVGSYLLGRFDGERPVET